MTNSQISYIASALNYNTEVSDNYMGYAPLFNNKMFIVSKEELLYSDVNRWRYKINTTKSLIERCYVRIYSYTPLRLPKHGNYDYYKVSTLPHPEQYGNHEWVVFEYLTDDNDNMITDYYSFDSVMMCIPKGYKNPTSLFVGD